jgi:hypothetical protein
MIIFPKIIGTKVYITPFKQTLIIFFKLSQIYNISLLFYAKTKILLDIFKKKNLRKMLEANLFLIFDSYSYINSIDQLLDLWDPLLTYVGFT